MVSDLSDSRERPRVRLRELGLVAARVADAAVFVGEHGHHAVRAAIAAGMDAARLRSFPEVSAAAPYLTSLLRDGDLVLVKGRATDHLSRAVLAQFGPVGCWKTRCAKRILCDICAELRPGFDVGAIPRA